MKITELNTDIQKLLDDSLQLEHVERELEKCRHQLSKAEIEIVNLQEKVSRIRGRNKNALDGIDEEELFRNHAKLRFTSHINGVRALHVKANGFGKMFTSRDSRKGTTLLGEAMSYLRENVWRKR